MSTFVRYYKKDSGRNAGIIVAYGNWPSRILKHRGWKKQITMRVTTKIEDDWLNECLRLQAIRYDSLDDLIADETNIVEPNVLDYIKLALADA